MSEEQGRGWIQALESMLPVAAFAYAMLLVWSFLAPADATSVFQGEAIPQNFGWLVAGGLAALATVGYGGFGFRRGQWVIVLTALAWLLFLTWLAGADCNPRRAWNGSWQILALAASYFAGLGLLRGTEARTTVALLLLVSMLALSLHGLYQIAVVFPQTRAAYLEDPEKLIASVPGLVAQPGSPQRERFESRLFSPEPYATFALANSLGCVLSPALVLLIGGLIRALERRQIWSKVLPRFGIMLFLWAGAGALVACCWLLTLSRSAYVAVVAGLACLLVLRLWNGTAKKHSPKILWTGAVSIAGLLLLGTAWLWWNNRRVLSEAQKSLGYRLEYWQATMGMLGDHLGFGIGLGNFQAYYPQYKLARASEEIADPHNWVLDIAVTLGVPVLLFVLCWLAWVFGGALRSWSLYRSMREAGENADFRSVPGVELADTTVARALLWGATLGGMVCSLLLWLLSGVDVAILWLAWIPALLVGVALRPLLAKLVHESFDLFVIGVLVMLISLLASGSWQASGVAVPLLAMLALAAPDPRVDRFQGKNLPDAAETSRRNALWRGLGTIALPMLAVVAFVFQAWLPVTRAWTHTQKARYAPDSNSQIESARLAIQADPLDNDLRGQLAQLRVAQAMQSERFRFAGLASQAVEALEEWLDGDRQAFSNWRLAGQQTFDLTYRAWELGLREQEEGLAGQAVHFFGKAVELYPTSVELQIQLAAVAAWGGELKVAADALEAGIALSEATPHEDKKLARHRSSNSGDQQIHFPFPGVEGGRASSLGMVKAEPLIKWIRSKLGNSQSADPT